ncbi:MAG TPA: ABC transporter ATP-binding protein [Oscillospiraceae bacterium]|nr:ABC transporter ATP-binding protein [Oscillospiraceae bacterium]
MIKLARYLKPFILVLVFSIALLFGEAMCDLNLPNYMSDIVNVGIQQNGIENATPEAISAKGLTLMKTFMTDSQKKDIENNYTLVSAKDTGSQHDDYVKKYSLLKTEDIYVLKSVSADTLTSLNKTFGEATWTFINTMKSVSKQTGAKTSNTGTSTNISSADFAKLYQMQPMLNKIPPKMIEDARTDAKKNADSMLVQSGAAMTKNFYQELGMDIGAIQRNFILKTGFLMLLIALAGGAATVLVGYFAAKVAAGFARDLRHDLFRKVSNFSHNEFDQYSTASLITRTTNDVTQVQMLIMMGIRMICYAPIIGIGGVIMALRKSSSMSWVIALACVILIGLMLFVFIVAVPKFKIIQKQIDRLNLVSRENLNGLMVIRAFGTEQFETERFDKTNKDLTKTNLFVNRIMMTVMMPAMMLIFNGVSILIVWVGAHQIAASTMQVGDMMAFMQYAMQIIMSFLMLSIIFILVPRAAVSGARIQEVLATKPTILDPEHSQEFQKDKTGYVEFKNVNFRYHGADEDVLQNITFTAKPGQTTAFIGSTGSGKSTLINLIPRFYDVTAGEIDVSGVNVKDVSQEDLRNQIGYVPQKGVLISGTIASNLRYGDENATEEDLKTAATVAQAMEFISQKEEGFESPIAESGSNVSGGQKQRLSIARALAKKPSIYIFDDSFSALDFKTDAALRRALKEHTGNSTVLIVAQRVSTIMGAEQIIVLDEGKIVGMGTHKELLKDCPQYLEIASSQLSKEELE